MFLRASVSLAVNQKGKCVTVGGEGHGLGLSYGVACDG